MHLYLSEDSEDFVWCGREFHFQVSNCICITKHGSSSRPLHQLDQDQNDATNSYPPPLTAAGQLPLQLAIDPTERVADAAWFEQHRAFTKDTLGSSEQHKAAKVTSHFWFIQLWTSTWELSKRIQHDKTWYKYNLNTWRYLKHYLKHLIGKIWEPWWSRCLWRKSWAALQKATRFLVALVAVYGAKGAKGMPLHHIASYCIILHHIASYCIILHHIASYCIILHHIASIACSWRRRLNRFHWWNRDWMKHSSSNLVKIVTQILSPKESKGQFSHYATSWQICGLHVWERPQGNVHRP